jgi:hypothetical protein
MSLQREKKHSVCFWKKGSEPIIQKMILAVLTFLLIIMVATSVFKDVYAYEPEYAQEDTLFIKTEEPQVNVIPNANTNSSLESAKHCCFTTCILTFDFCFLGKIYIKAFNTFEIFQVQ